MTQSWIVESRNNTAVTLLIVRSGWSGIRDQISLLCNSFTLQPPLLLLLCHIWTHYIVMPCWLCSRRSKVRALSQHRFIATSVGATVSFSVTCRKLPLLKLPWLNLMSDFFADGCSATTCESCGATRDCQWVNCTCEYLSRLWSERHRLVFVWTDGTHDAWAWGEFMAVDAVFWMMSYQIP